MPSRPSSRPRRAAATTACPGSGGSNAGGSGQPAIKVVGDVTRAGYNLVNGRGVTDTSSIAPASCSSLSCQTWTSPQAAVEWATRVLGEKEQRTCDACTKTETTPGVGLTPLIQEEYDAKLQALQDLVSKARTRRRRTCAKPAVRRCRSRAA
jgi:integrating conjugative element protein (TIGR03755 family)